MTYRFMQQHTGPARAQYNGHGTRGCCIRFQVDQRLPHRFIGKTLPGIILDQLQVIESPTTAITALLTPTFVLCDHGDVQTHEWPYVSRQRSVC